MQITVHINVIKPMFFYGIPLMGYKISSFHSLGHRPCVALECREIRQAVPICLSNGIASSFGDGIDASTSGVTFVEMLKNAHRASLQSASAHVFYTLNQILSRTSESTFTKPLLESQPASAKSCSSRFVHFCSFPRVHGNALTLLGCFHDRPPTKPLASP